jgi:hypothetical protein
MRSTIRLVTARDWHRLRPLMSPVLAALFRGSQFSKTLTGVDLGELGRLAASCSPASRCPAPSSARRWPPPTWTGPRPGGVASMARYCHFLPGRAP